MSCTKRKSFPLLLFSLSFSHFACTSAIVHIPIAHRRPTDLAILLSLSTILRFQMADSLGSVYSFYLDFFQLWSSSTSAEIASWTLLLLQSQSQPKTTTMSFLLIHSFVSSVSFARNCIFIAAARHNRAGQMNGRTEKKMPSEYYYDDDSDDDAEFHKIVMIKICLCVSPASLPLLLLFIFRGPLLD